MSDVFIGYDGGQFFRTYLYSYNGNLYDLMTDLNNFATATPIRMYKSTNGGATWSALSSTLSGEAGFNVSGPPVVIGTKLYIHYASNSASLTALAYFDFTTDTFNAVTTTGNLDHLTDPFMVGSVATLFYIGDAQFGGNGIQISKYSSNVFSAVALISPTGGNTFCQQQVMFLGSSGVTHILFCTGTTSTGAGNLVYGNIVGGVLTSGTAVYSSFQDRGAGFGGNSTGPALQIGSNILFSFYDAINHQVKLMSFTDTSSPTFTVSVIDSSFTIAVPTSTFFPTGYWSTVLALYGSTLYCFYVNTNAAGVGDGNVYYRTSTDNGATWSARQTLVSHLDPIQGTAFAVWLPEAIQYVDSGTAAKVSYLQLLNDSSSQYGSGRFFFGVVTESARNYVLS